MEKRKPLSPSRVAILFGVVYCASYVTRINFAAVIQEVVTATGFERPQLAIIPVCLFVTYGVGQIINGYLGTVNVADVKLELMRTVQQDNITKGLVVPVWNFYGTRQRHFDSDQFDDDETMNMLLLSLNAVSGNPINASLGY